VAPRILIPLLLTLNTGFADIAAGSVITKCGASVGYRYDVPGPLSEKSSALGWSEDRISNGSFLLAIDGDAVDIITTDVVGTRSTKADGATVLMLSGGAAGTFIVLAVSPTGTVEHFLFSLRPDGRGEVVWGTSRAQGTLPKSSLMRAECTPPQ